MNMVARQVIEIPYGPRAQFVDFHERKNRWSVIVAHRRCGKTVATINDMIVKALFCPRENGRYAYVAPFLAQAKEVAWEYLKRFSQPAIRDKNEAELWVELLNGARIRIHGADNPDRLRGAYLDGVVLDEYADMRSSVWGEVIRPMLADREGWGVFIGTPKGKNEFWSVWNNAGSASWFRLMLKASETGILSEAELSDAQRDMTPAQYAQEFECSFEAAITGAYYGPYMAKAASEGRIGKVPYEPLLPVHTAWDLGIGDPTAIWFFQVSGNEIRIIDFYENSGVGLDHYANILRDREYSYGIHWVPHDAKVLELGTGKTRVETLIKLGVTPKVVPDHRIMDGINASRLTIPKCWFDEKKTADGLECLRQYRAEWDERTKVYRDNARHDFTSHAADAFRYLAMAWREMVPEIKDKPKPNVYQEMTYKDFLDTEIAPKRDHV
jgi:phage terminase large subunit